ncbi:MAG: hypothetical protein ACRBHB_08185 [Arenicella sp.]
MTENTGKKRLLKVLVKLCCVVVFAVFTGIIINGMFWSPSTSNSPKWLDTMTLGETKLLRFGSKRQWVTRLNVQQQQFLQGLSDHVYSDSACSLQQSLCQVYADSVTQGVLIQFVQKTPDQLPADVPWNGGFVDPGNGAIYDLSGRGYVSNVDGARKSIAIEASELRSQ